MTQSVFGNWKNPNIVYLCGELSPISEELRERLERREWKISYATDDAIKAIEAIRGGEGSVLIVNDTMNLPAIIALRSRLSDAIATLTPTIIATSEASSSDAKYIEEIGKVDVFEQPLGPSRVIDCLEMSLRRWSTGDLSKLTEARILLCESETASAIKVLTSCLSNKELAPYALQCLANALKGEADNKQIEKLLLGALKEHSRNLGVILTIIGFYLRVAMPETALKLINLARKNYTNPRIILLDQIQAYLMLNRVEESIPLIENLLKMGLMPGLMRNYLLRCLYAEGFTDQLTGLTDGHGSVIDHFQQEWSSQSAS